MGGPTRGKPTTKRGPTRGKPTTKPAANRSRKETFANSAPKKPAAKPRPLPPKKPKIFDGKPVAEQLMDSLVNKMIVDKKNLIKKQQQLLKMNEPTYALHRLTLDPNVIQFRQRSAELSNAIVELEDRILLLIKETKELEITNLTEALKIPNLLIVFQKNINELVVEKILSEAQASQLYDNNHAILAGKLAAALTFEHLHQVFNIEISPNLNLAQREITPLSSSRGGCHSRANGNLINKNYFNISNSIVPDHISIIINKGPKFIPTPKFNTYDVYQSYEKILKVWMNTHTFGLSPPVANTVKGELKEISDAFHFNFTNKLYSVDHTASSNEGSVLNKWLQKNKLLLLNTDKNLGFALCNLDWYHNQVLTHLNDTLTYKEIDTVNFEQIATSFRKICNNWEFHTWDSETYNKLLKDILSIAHKKFLPQFHVLPKVHKDPIKSRPILPTIGSITSATSCYLTDQLLPVLDHFPWVLKDTFDFVKSIQEFSNTNPVELTENDFIMTTADASSLYTNLETKICIANIRNFLLKNFIYPISKIELICELLRWVFSNNYFVYNNRKYLQKCGIAMGTNVAPVFANLALAIQENDLLIYNKNNKLLYTPLFYRRFIDDAFAINCKSTHVLFSNRLSKLYNKVTWNFEVGNNLAFLDTMVKYRKSIDRYYKIEHEIYFKEINKFIYPNPQSHQPQNYTYGWIRGEFYRIARNCSTINSFLKHKQAFKYRLQVNGYPETLLDKLFFNFTFQSRHLYLDKKVKPINKLNSLIPIPNQAGYNLIKEQLVYLDKIATRLDVIRCPSQPIILKGESLTTMASKSNKQNKLKYSQSSNTNNIPTITHGSEVITNKSTETINTTVEENPEGLSDWTIYSHQEYEQDQVDLQQLWDTGQFHKFVKQRQIFNEKYKK
jgi:hypothetical protein